MKNILVPVDFSDVTERVIDNAEKLARVFSSKIWLIHCVNDYPNYATGEIPAALPTLDKPIQQRFSAESERLEKLTTEMHTRGIEVEGLLVVGVAVDEILATADQHNADLIIMGSHGHGAIYEFMVGTVTKAVLHHATRPTLIVPSGTYKEMKAVPATVEHVQWETPVVADAATAY